MSGHDVHFGNRAELLHGIVPVEHGRKLEHKIVTPCEQLVAQCEHIGCAVANSVCACSMLVAPCRVEEDDMRCFPDVCFLKREKVNGIAASYFHPLKSQGLKVMCSEFAKFGRPFDV